MATLEISHIRRDGGTQPRDVISLTVAQDYAEAIADGAILPPVTVFYDGTDYWLADGFHRVEAVGEYLKRTTIEADIRQGTQRDAILYSCSANTSHGWRRTNDDKRRAITRLLSDSEWSRWSDSDIRKHCNVSLDMVQRYRASITYRTVSEKPPTPAPAVPDAVRARAREIEDGGGVPRFYKNRHGSVSVMRTDKIGTRSGRSGDAPDKGFTEPAADPLPGRGSRQLRTYLNERRAGADTKAAAEKAGIPIGEAELHDEAEAEGEYADVIALPERVEPLRYEPVALDPTTGHPLLLAVGDVFAQVAAWPSASDVLAMCEVDLGDTIQPEQIANTAAWMAEFTAGYPNRVLRRDRSDVA